MDLLTAHLTMYEILLPGQENIAEPSAACDIWFARIDNCGFPATLLSEEEATRRERFVKDVDATRYLAGCVMARLFIAGRLSVDARSVVIDRTCPRCGADHGKPRAIATDWRYSISHSGEYVAVAFSEGRDVGIDLEVDGRQRPEDVWAAVLSPEELACLRALEPGQQDRAFLRYWTRKEALLKCTGHGLTVEPRLLRVSAPDEAPSLLSAPAAVGSITDYRLTDLDFLPRHVAALALEGRQAQIRAFEVKAVPGVGT